MLASTDDTCDTMLDIASYNAIMLYKILGFSICSSECPRVLRLLHNVTEIIPIVFSSNDQPQEMIYFATIWSGFISSFHDSFSRWLVMNDNIKRPIL